MSTISAELDWIQQLLEFLHVQPARPPVLFCDNPSAIALSFNPVQHQRTKHIEIDVHFVRERVAQTKFCVQFVSSREQFADILTKGLSTPLFQSHCFNLMLGSSPHEFAGACGDLGGDVWLVKEVEVVVVGIDRSVGVNMGRAACGVGGR
ncbi:hypothetical protein DVH24_039092 [Malus domestica]|uniref:RNase H type-1 domain-containing protein n=1 Tax=Malus domestica TaxID=3750 RepID=A0A498KBE0_MALDO|nr:hypothetical protein DVH24_039092 [Malus domestica]